MGTAQLSRQSATRRTPQRADCSPGSRAPARCRQSGCENAAPGGGADTSVCHFSRQGAGTNTEATRHTATRGLRLIAAAPAGPSHSTLLAELQGTRFVQQHWGLGQAGRCAEWILLKTNMMSVQTTPLRVSSPSPCPHWSVLQLFGDRGRRYGSCLPPRRRDLTPRTAIFIPC